MPVLDTSFLIDLQRKEPHALRALEVLTAASVDLLVPAQVAVEYLSGIEDRATALAVLEASFRVLDFGRDQLVEAARLARDAFDRGAFPGWADVQIGAAASLQATYVVTANGDHFRQLGLPVWDPRSDPTPPSRS